MKEKKKISIKKILLVLVVFLLGMAAMFGIIHLIPKDRETVITKLEKNVTVTDTGISDAVDKVYDAVVVVNTYVNGKEYASGTGFVYKTQDSKAYILTNNHVISNASDVYVTFTDGTVVKTEVIGSDTYSDIAVLAVDKKHVISIAEIGNSEEARLGDTVFAIGAPLDDVYSWSVTRGILSGKDRLVEVQMTSGNTTTPMIVNTLQTDAAINSGNSGGPLANSNGEVIGITSIKLASEAVEGMGFAIPIETAIDYAEELIKGKEIERPYLGVYMLDITDAFYSREYYSLIKEADVTKGVVIADVEAKSSADLAGLKKNDIVTKVDGEEVATSAYLRYYLYKHKVGDEMKLTVIRDNKEIEVKVKLTAK